ncbi:MAG: BlaI/MecI/CopY family transcriptional regulator [Thermoanaerobaculales bacterium]|jgi:predicted transcriptional regulator|nr:BlaI/MecI/CopY family transcriptional regulator [Thermoanaerobaculales bacterium]
MTITFKALPQLSPSELELMKLLWEADGLSAREVHERLSGRLDWAYSTTRTTLERMVRKGLVAKREFHGLHLYTASVSRAAGLARLVRDFARQVVGSSPAPVVSLFAANGTLAEEEVAELRRLLDEAGEGEA